MTQTLLKFLLIRKVQEYYFINLTIVTLAFLAFHPQGLKDWTINHEDPIKAIFSVVFGAFLLIIISWALVKNKDHKFMYGNHEGVSFIPLLVLTTVSFMASITSFQVKGSSIEHTVTSFFLAVYSVRLFILTFYSFLERYNFNRNPIYKSIKQRLNDAVGNYQTNISEVTIVAFVTLMGAYVLTKTSINPFTQYLTVYLIADTVAWSIEKIRISGVIKNLNS